MVLAAARASEHQRLELVATLDAMASQSRTLPVLVAAACCAAVLRSFWAASPPTFVAPQQSVHMGCQALSSGALAAGQVPAIVNTVPARPGVPAHFKVTAFSPWHLLLLDTRSALVSFGVSAARSGISFAFYLKHHTVYHWLKPW